MDEILKLLPGWALFVILLLLGGGGIGFIAYIAQPTKDVIEDLQKTQEKQALQIESLTAQLRAAFDMLAIQGHVTTALRMHSDQLRLEIIRRDPKAEIETSDEVLRRVHLMVASSNFVNRPDLQNDAAAATLTPDP